MATELTNILSYATQLGYDLPSQDKSDNDFHSRFDCEDETTKWTSLLIRICEIRAKIINIANEIEFWQNYLETFDLVSKERLEQRMAHLQQLTEHLQQILNGKETLASFVQQPYPGQHLIVEGPHQRDFCRLFKQMAEDIRFLPNLLTSVQWAAKFWLSHNETEHWTNELNSQLTVCHVYYDTLYALRQTTQRLQSHIDNTSQHTKLPTINK
jgi:hypothetical protein